MRIILFLIAVIKGDCLPKDLLKGLGFLPLDKPQANQTFGVCDNVFQQFGSCVDTDQLKTRMADDMENLRLSMMQYFHIGDIILQLGTLFEAQPRFSLNRTYYSQVIKNIYFEGVSVVSKCYRLLATLQQGTSCLLASGNATDVVDKADFDGKVAFFYIRTLLSEDSIKEVQSCIPFYDAICLGSCGLSLRYNVSLRDSFPLTDFNIFYSSFCDNLKTAFSSLDENATLRQLAKIIINKLKPYYYQYVPNDLDNAAVLKKLRDQTAALSGSARALQSSNAISPFLVEFVYNEEDPGPDVFLVGKQSSMPVKNFSFATLLCYGIAILLHTLFN